MSNSAPAAPPVDAHHRQGQTAENSTGSLICSPYVHDLTLLNDVSNSL